MSRFVPEVGRGRAGIPSDLSLGKMLDKRAQTGEHPTPYLKNINVRWFSFDLAGMGLMDVKPEELDRVTALPGDLVVCEGGEPGRCAVWGGDPVAIQKALHRVRPAAGIDARYLSYALAWWTRREAFGSFITGTTIKHLPKEKLEKLPMPVAPAAEQCRIVDELEGRLTHVDAAVRGLRSALKVIEQARRAILLEPLREPGRNTGGHSRLRMRVSRDSVCSAHLTVIRVRT